MAWRIEEHVIRGEIDNRVRGRVVGKVWLSGVGQPLILDLKGDCHPDLAGCLLGFENPRATPMPAGPPATRQRGTVGDMTAARKVRVYDVPLSEALAMIKSGGKPPEHMANSLYLEWFSALSGRVVIESADYRLQVSEPAWCFSAEEWAERERLTAEAANPFANSFDQDANEEQEPWDEFRFEQLLRESDLAGEKYRKLMEEYMDHPDRDRIIAHEMGWEGLEEGGDGDEKTLEDDVMADGDDEGDDEDWSFGDRNVHPVAQRARDLLDAWLVDHGEDDGEEEKPGVELMEALMSLRVKVDTHLGFVVEEDRSMEAGMLIAWLKRDLEIANRALAAVELLNDHPAFSVERLSHYRSELFAIREGVLGVIADLREGDGRW